MSRFQALTNSVLDAELEMLRERLGLEPNQKAMPRRICWRGRTWPSMTLGLTLQLAHTGPVAFRLFVTDAIDARAARLCERFGLARLGG
ncbi:hypothetical protein WMF04_07630 [Sorangium sp. So ce260]|uniref:hypothetical protein n=1 Tax=Sorangium sp. So ce260 TaxID=3133291 RepID=UPI003F5E0C21